MKKVILLVMFLFILAACNQQPDLGPGPLDEFAQCVYDSGARMYGSHTCSVCAKQKELFGISEGYIREIECHPRGSNPQLELCLEKGIEKTPTWIFEKDGEEVNRLEGFQTLESLAIITGCPLEE